MNKQTLLTFIDGIESDRVPMVDGKVADAPYGWYDAVGREHTAWLIGVVELNLENHITSGEATVLDKAISWIVR